MNIYQYYKKEASPTYVLKVIEVCLGWVY